MVLSIHVDRGSLSTNHKLASQNSSNADVSTAGLQFSSGQTSMQVQFEILQKCAKWARARGFLAIENSRTSGSLYKG